MAKPQDNNKKCIVCERDYKELEYMLKVVFPDTGYFLCCDCHLLLCGDEYFKTNLVKNSLVKTDYKKKKIPYDLRVKVYERDGYRCVYCNSHKDLTLDHVIPESKGGAINFDNLVTSCRGCNSRKGVMSKGDFENG